MTKETKEQIEMALELIEIFKQKGLMYEIWSSDTLRKFSDILRKVDCESVRKELLVTQPKHTYQLKVAIGRSGKLVILESFPSGEAYEGLREMTPELEDGEYDEKPGVYMADVVVETYDGGIAGPEYAQSYLNIVRFTEV